MPKYQAESKTLNAGEQPQGEMHLPPTFSFEDAMRGAHRELATVPDTYGASPQLLALMLTSCSVVIL